MDKQDEYSRLECADCGCSIGWVHYLHPSICICEDCFQELRNNQDCIEEESEE